ncbi:hypothetical protein KBZ18_06325 [Synechococcus sp. Cruz-9H2]|uniref:hypothetical protein n=1 Tax=unclassified Synechococcus TaxID=2626047 RepID=UPI0020CD2170|nr:MULTISPECIES: hypothetical protein [unclassified Synechococcus]MCP9819104.1 hypothetical protein [Synechococcus sp. Cruz-9H2]MCP9843608.1 hypothetical protein [Synechococcus sp. Edmonson 11F2]MCP9855673.1 hypothetical protein [Synechococcus sp. Cruz-9C9]MCP9863111.1 hypothetical protein [Synechococcus sp. Cruz-7E5]MCP9870014.1 hypothetical protein [Synechococcus sp. Cruz-7B9]
MPRLETVDFWLEAAPGLLLPQVRSALAERGDPLRWAITAVLPAAEGSSPRRRLRIEAVLLQIP